MKFVHENLTAKISSSRENLHFRYLKFHFRIKLTDPPTSIRNAIQIAELEERMALEKAILQELTKVRLSFRFYPDHSIDSDSGFDGRFRYVIGLLQNQRRFCILLIFSK